MNPQLGLWIYRVMFVGFAMLTIAIPLLPLGFSPTRPAMPDLFFVLTIAWVVRNQRSAPLILVAGLALLADAVLMRPIGLWALLIVISAELARMNDRLIQDGGIIAEMAMFAVILVIAQFIQNALLFVTFADPYPIDRLAQIVMLSLLCYPLFALVLHYILRVRGPSTKNLPDRLGKVG